MAAEARTPNGGSGARRYWLRGVERMRPLGESAVSLVAGSALVGSSRRIWVRSHYDENQGCQSTAVCTHRGRGEPFLLSFLVSPALGIDGEGMAGLTGGKREVLSVETLTGRLAAAPGGGSGS